MNRYHQIIQLNFRILLDQFHLRDPFLLNLLFEYLVIYRMLHHNQHLKIDRLVYLDILLLILLNSFSCRMIFLNLLVLLHMLSLFYRILVKVAFYHHRLLYILSSIFLLILLIFDQRSLSNHHLNRIYHLHS